jgi:hypothetical protein
MAGQTAIEAATERLNRALNLMDAAVDRRIEIEKSRSILTEQVHALDADRARLAAELDTQTARARRLEAANREVAKRIDAAMDNVRAVLEARER